ncbi:MAG: hypothetical protein COW19_04465 [Zetaproteobacteria bacterium CG12_big_fil_rev_8_21_14_0_65_55_1124]|nr:MAG: hypothetical protein AUJ58_07010 [Zetaproteobacteria bacterium CG1_02_55_237]PIS20273.1 MAG: hypothetical protein COT53_01415 [Zetaproteobacteria bacterium CG08_land_8_20_14_0_20_55_17]PIW43150.1 MAG: hypothetical protein COW19_04465 [Zetaproteobacteria bacterium CG12_big_fil_rev_8_21_14_0_65_55_1124]PIY52114.1 MAG: hypothetical protein COZ01_08915 [Zetaproteobacteria bacterium CG_4_10_14_0_8_um_filter_55_43]PIZ38126.1 MAG: hypothetical protein COY36_07115 [Zetaproteobacteria bacterium 
MKKMLMIAAVAAFMVGGIATPASAKAFCAACHAGHKDKVGPAFATVVKAYGSVDAVFAFLDSDAELEPKVAAFASKKSTMASQVKKYRKLSAEKKAEVREFFEAELK